MTVFSHLVKQVGNSAIEMGSLISVRLMRPRQWPENILKKQSGHDYYNRQQDCSNNNSQNGSR